jgi:hypothetical protein
MQSEDLRGSCDSAVVELYIKGDFESCTDILTSGRTAQ